MKYSTFYPPLSSMEAAKKNSISMTKSRIAYIRNIKNKNGELNSKTLVFPAYLLTGL